MLEEPKADWPNPCFPKAEPPVAAPPKAEGAPPANAPKPEGLPKADPPEPKAEPVAGVEPKAEAGPLNADEGAD